MSNEGSPLVENAAPFCDRCKSRRDVDPEAEGFLVFHCYCALLGINIAGHPDPEECGYEPDAPSVEERLDEIESRVEGLEIFNMRFD